MECNDDLMICYTYREKLHDFHFDGSENSKTENDEGFSRRPDVLTDAKRRYVFFCSRMMETLQL